MRPWVILRRALIAAGAFAGILTATALGVAVGVDAGLFRGTLIRLISSFAQRPVDVAGTLHAHLLARHPSLEAERVTIGSPAWAPGAALAEIGEISLVMDVPWFQGGFGIVSVSMQSAALHLRRDPEGHANWQWRNPDLPTGTKALPILRSLSIPDAHVSLDDERRHLQFDGVVTAEGAAPGPAPRLRIEGHGRLNGHPDSFEITGDALTAARHRIPYHFSFTERSSGSQLAGHGLLPEPFDFNLIDAFFEARGADLRDLYFLTGVTLINTGDYRLTGKILRRGTLTRFEDLAVSTGQSDARGSVSVDMSRGRPRLSIDLRSQRLKMADLGLHAAGRAPPPTLLLSDATLKPSTLRRGDADLRFRAARLEIGRFELTGVATKGTIERGALEIAPLTAGILGGKLDAHLRLDATADAPKAVVNMQFSDLALAGLFRESSSPPPAEGRLEVRIAVTGIGKSVHQIAASANGTITATVLDGSVKNSLAEMTGVDLRGFGLLLTKNQTQTPVLCAVGDLEARDGTLIARRLVADTPPVLITAAGQIHLDSETLDLSISGHPKGARLIRFRSPVLVKGTLAHPAIEVHAHGLQLVDPGGAPQAGCTAPPS